MVSRAEFCGFPLPHRQLLAISLPPLMCHIDSLYRHTSTIVLLPGSSVQTALSLTVLSKHAVTRYHG
eukprot:3999205-Prorocentrum_lima.AAC.1